MSWCPKPILVFFRLKPLLVGWKMLGSFQQEQRLFNDDMRRNRRRGLSISELLICLGTSPTVEEDDDPLRDIKMDFEMGVDSSRHVTFIARRRDDL